MFRLTWRNLVARKVRLLMSTLAIVLGIGFLAGVMTFSSGLGATFDNIIKGSTPDGVVRAEGQNTFEGVGAGSTTLLKPRDVARLGDVPEVGSVVGSVDGMGAFLLDGDGKLVGGQGAPTIAFNYAASDNMLGEPAMILESGDWPTQPGEVTLDSTAADKAGYDIGDQVSLIVPFGEPLRQLTLVGTATFNGGGTAGAILVVLETSQAQDFFLEGANAFTSVALTAADGVSQKQLVDAVAGAVPDGFEAVTGDAVVKESQNTIGQFLDVISIFLTTFAVIAIVVGAFIIFNTFSILVSQRVRESALLRALGASRKQVMRSVLFEAFLMALFGSALGLLLGLGLARLLAALFRSFGLDIAGDVLTLTPTTVLAGFVVGTIVTMVAAFVPAWRAGKVPPVAAMRDEVATQDKSLRRRLLLGSVALVIGSALAAVGLSDGPGNNAIWIGAGAVIWVITVAVMAPVLGHPVLVACRAVFGRLFGTAGHLAGQNALRNPRRTGATASALMIGLAVVSAVGVLAASLQETNDAVVEEAFQSDYLVQSPTFQGFPTSVGDKMADVSGVSVVSRQQGTPAQIDGEDQWVTGADADFTEVFKLDLLEGTDALTGDQAMLTKSGADDLGLDVGSTLPLTFPAGKTIEVTVAGIIDDSVVTSAITVPLSVLKEAGLKRNDMTLAINLAEGADPAAVKLRLDEVVDELPVVTVQDKKEFAEWVSGQVNQLLYMIYGLLALAVVIAVIGIVNTLGLSVLERTREIGLLRAVGLSRRRLRRMITLESVAIALLGAVLGMVVGLVIGVVLRQSLADDLTELALPLANLAIFLVVAVVFGVLAAIVPAIRASRMKVLEAIATE